MSFNELFWGRESGVVSRSIDSNIVRLIPEEFAREKE